VPPMANGSGNQCCYDSKGNLCTTLPCAGTWDRVSPIIGEDPSGGCIWSIRGQWDHIWKDILPW
jgi:hypothetical protein